MTTLTIYPKPAPQVLVGDLDLLDPIFYSYGTRRDSAANKEFQRTFINRLAVRGYSTTILDGVLDDRFADYERQYSTRTFFYNYTQHPVVILERDGIPKALMPDGRISGMKRPGVMIRRETFFDGRDTMSRTFNALSATPVLQSQELSQVQALLKKNLFTVGCFGAMTAVEYFIPEEEIENADRAVYHQKTDIVISFNSILETPKHPASSEYIETQSFMTQPGMPIGQHDLSLMMRYVSDDPNATPKYVRFANKIFVLKPESNHPSKLLEVASRDKKSTDRVLEERSEYIEFLYPAKADTANSNAKGVRCMRVAIDEAKALYGIFDSYQEVSDPKDVLEVTNRKLNDKLDLQSQELTRQKRAAEEKLQATIREHEEKLAQFQMAMRQKDEEIAELKRGRDVRLEALKEVREAQAHKQKVGFETVKFFTNLVTIFVGMLPLFLKLRPAAK